MGILGSLGRALSSFLGFLRNNWLSIVAAAALLTVIGLAIFPPTWVLIAATVLSFGFIATTGAAAAAPLALATVSAIMGACVYAAGSILGLIGRAGHWAFSSLFSAKTGATRATEAPTAGAAAASSSSAAAISEGLTSGAGARPEPSSTSGAASAPQLDEVSSPDAAASAAGSEQPRPPATPLSTAADGAKKPTGGGWHVRGLSTAALLARFRFGRSQNPGTSVGDKEPVHTPSNQAALRA